MRNHLRGIALIAITSLSFSARAGEGLSRSDARKMVKRFAVGDEAEREKVIEELGENDHIEKARELEKLADYYAKYVEKRKDALEPEETDLTAKLSPQRKTFNKQIGVGVAPVAAIETPNGTMRVVLITPKRMKKPTAAVVYLHGGGGGADENEMAWGWGMVRAPKIASVPVKIIPRAVDDSGVNSWVRYKEAQNVETVLNRILASYEVDPNRVYILGVSMGGFGAWQFASASGDRFAAIASNGGGSSLKGDAYVNLRNVNFGVFIGEDDTQAGRLSRSRGGRDALQALKQDDPEGYPLHYKEYPGVEHKTPDNVYADIDKYFEENERVAYPRTVVWAPQVGWKARYYNIAIPAPKQGMKVRVVCGEDNVVTIESENVPALTIYLNDELVDLEKDVAVVWNGEEKFKGTLPRRLSVLLRTLGERNDTGMCYSAAVALGNL